MLTRCYTKVSPFAVLRSSSSVLIPVLVPPARQVIVPLLDLPEAITYLKLIQLQLPVRRTEHHAALSDPDDHSVV